MAVVVAVLICVEMAVVVVLAVAVAVTVTVSWRYVEQKAEFALWLVVFRAGRGAFTAQSLAKVSAWDRAWEEVHVQGSLGGGTACRLTTSFISLPKISNWGKAGVGEDKEERDTLRTNNAVLMETILLEYAEV